MFQKLYRHLEDISTHLRDDRSLASNSDMADRIAEKLDAVHSAIISQTRLLQAQEGRLEEKGKEKVGFFKYLPRASVAVFSIGVVLVLALGFLTFNLVKLGNREEVQQPVEINTSYRTAAFVEDSVRRYALQEEHIAVLDSLVAEQSRSLIELKKLNTTAVATFRRMRKHFAAIDSLSAAR